MVNNDMGDDRMTTETRLAQVESELAEVTARVRRLEGETETEATTETERFEPRPPSWTGDTDKLSRSIEFADFTTAVEFINRLAPRCEDLDHHPDLRLRWRWVDVQLSTHSAGGVTGLDLTLAEIVDEVAAGLPQAGPAA